MCLEAKQSGIIESKDPFGLFDTAFGCDFQYFDLHLEAIL